MYVLVVVVVEHHQELDPAEKKEGGGGGEGRPQREDGVKNGPGSDSGTVTRE